MPFSSNTRILQLKKNLHKLEQGYLSITANLNKAKIISNSLAAAICPLSIENLNLYFFKLLYSEFKDFTTTLNAHQSLFLSLIFKLSFAIMSL